MSRAPVSLVVVAAAVLGVGLARSAPHEADVRHVAAPPGGWVRVRVSAFDYGTHPLAINDRGQILGVTGGSFVVWRGGSVHDLGVAVDNLSLAGDLNDRGEVVGATWERRLRRTLAFRWANGKKRTLGVLGRDAVYRVDDGYSVAHGINNHGQIVGESGNEFRERAVLWSNGRMSALPPDSRWHSSAAFAINDAGEVVGSTGSSSFERAVTWRRGKPTVLPSLGGASAAQDINERGQIVGWSTGMDGRDHAVLWEHGRIRVLAAGFTVARAIDDAGVIVGSCGDAACVWENGRLTNLGAVRDTARAIDINDRRQIVGEVVEDCQGGCTPATAVYLWGSRS